MTQWLNETEMRIWRGFLAAANNVTQPVDASLKTEAGLGLDDYEVLVHLSEAPDHRLRMNELSERLLHSRSRLTQRIDRMEERGLVRREKSADDARGTLAVLTETGWSTIVEAAPRHLLQVRRAIIDRIPAEHQEIIAECFDILRTPVPPGD